MGVKSDSASFFLTGGRGDAIWELKVRRALNFKGDEEQRELHKAAGRGEEEIVSTGREVW